MSAAYLHLVLNHIPIFGVLFGVILLATGLIRNNIPFQKAGLYALLITALLTIVVEKTGHKAEHEIEETMEVDHNLIHEHEEAGELAQWLAIGLGVASLVLLVIMRMSDHSVKIYLYILLLGGIGLIVFLGKVNNSGGQIMHPEIRASSPE